MPVFRAGSEEGGECYDYNYIDENMPEWAREAVQWGVKNGIINGDGNGLNLTDSDLRYITWLHRAVNLKA